MFELRREEVCNFFNYASLKKEKFFAKIIQGPKRHCFLKNSIRTLVFKLRRIEVCSIMFKGLFVDSSLSFNEFLSN